MSLEPLDASKMLDGLKSQNPDMFREFFDLNCMDIQERHVKDRAVLDLGANLGYFAIKCRTLGSGPVLCVEPHPATYDGLRKNVGGLAGVTTLRHAAMDHRAKSVTLVEGDASGNAKSVPDGDV